MHSILLIVAAVAALATPSDPRDGHELLALMRRQPTYRTLTFVQTTKFPGRPDQTWYESLQQPSRLRIDFPPLDSQRAVIYRGDSSYSFALGRAPRARAGGNPLMVLLGDVFVLPAESSASRLTAMGVDLSKLRADTFRGRRAWVVGAVAGDSASPQFWIDAERLVMVRMIDRTPQGSFDAHVTRHAQFGNIWLETEMVFYRNGQEIQSEIYNEVRLNPLLDSLIFEPDQYRRPAWIPVTPGR